MHADSDSQEPSMMNMKEAVSFLGTTFGYQTIKDKKEELYGPQNFNLGPASCHTFFNSEVRC